MRIALDTVCGYHSAMAIRYRRLYAVFLVALLQCFAPLLHAHFDAEPHAASGVHQHDVVELYCLDGSPCPEAAVEALDTQGAATTRVSLKEFSDSSDPGILPCGLTSQQAQTRPFAVPPPGVTAARPSFLLPPAHAPPLV
jgi:hypothetical protein